MTHRAYVIRQATRPPGAWGSLVSNISLLLRGGARLLRVVGYYTWRRVSFGTQHARLGRNKGMRHPTSTSRASSGNHV